MPSNTDPIYTRAPDLQGAGAIIGPNANTAQDGTGANITSIFQADATNGGFAQKILFKAIGSLAATVIRIFLHTTTGAFTPGTTNTAANTFLIREFTAAAWTASNTTSSPDIEIALNFPIPAGMRLLAAFGTSTGAAGNGYNPVTVAGKY